MGDLDSHEEVRLSFAGPGEIERKGGGAGPSRQSRRDQEQGGGAGLRKLDFLLLRLFLNSSATDIVTVPRSS